MNFPDEYFPIADNLIKDFAYKLDIGREKAKKLNILFCAACKNVENTIKKIITIVDDTASYFNSYNIFLYENNSSDNTIEHIKSLNHKNLILKTEWLENSSYCRSNISQFERCNYIANARNKYVNFINENHHKYDYVFVFDADIEGGWSNNGILNSIYYLEENKDFGCMTSYCVLASARGGNLEDFPSDQWLMFDSFAFRFYGNWNFPNDLYMYNYIKIERGQLPMLVNSNFNGLAIYKPQCFIDNKYFVSNHGSDFMTDSEHIGFHKKIYEKGLKILLNPSMITSISNHKYSKGIN